MVFPFKVQDIVVGCIKLDDVNNIWTSEGVIYELEMLNKEELRFDMCCSVHFLYC